MRIQPTINDLLKVLRFEVAYAAAEPYECLDYEYADEVIDRMSAITLTRKLGDIQHRILKKETTK